MSLVKRYQDTPKIVPNISARNHTGKHLGKLTIKYPVGHDNSHLLWLAECECGTQVEVRAQQIVSGVIDSCGKCQRLLGTTLPELPYTLVDNELKEQGELPLEGPIDSVIEDVVGSMQSITEDATAPTAWAVAEECCDMLVKLQHKDRIKALQLVRVQLEYDL